MFIFHLFFGAYSDLFKKKLHDCTFAVLFFNPKMIYTVLDTVVPTSEGISTEFTSLISVIGNKCMSEIKSSDWD